MYLLFPKGLRISQVAERNINLSRNLDRGVSASQLKNTTPLQVKTEPLSHFAHLSISQLRLWGVLQNYFSILEGHWGGIWRTYHIRALRNVLECFCHFSCILQSGRRLVIKIPWTEYGKFEAGKLSQEGHFWYSQVLSGHCGYWMKSKISILSVLEAKFKR